MKRTCRKSFFCKLALCVASALGVVALHADTVYKAVWTQDFEDSSTYTWVGAAFT